MAAGAAAAHGSCGPIGGCGEYGAIVDVNWEQECAVERIYRSGVGDNGNVVSSTTSAFLRVVAAGSHAYWRSIAAAHRTLVSDIARCMHTSL